MRIYAVFSVLFLLCGLVVLGCGDSVEESDAGVLEPDGDFRFQDLPVVEGGSLIPPDEVPVIAIEKTREDAENIWWKLKADPVPSQGDLVVALGPNLPDDLELWPNRQAALKEGLLVSILKFENNSVEMKTLRSQTDWRLEVYSFFNLEGLIHFRHIHVPSAGFPRVPSFQLDDGYVVPQWFVFSYYLPGTTFSLEIPAKEQAQ